MEAIVWKWAGLELVGLTCFRIAMCGRAWIHSSTTNHIIGAHRNRDERSLLNFFELLT